MPKIIEGLRDNILETAKEMLFTENYRVLSMRSIAKRCGIATGTIYNYFENKEVLIANIMFQDWSEALREMAQEVSVATDIWTGLDGIRVAIENFIHIYEGVWKQAGAAGSGVLTSERHLMLCKQIATHIENLLCNNGYEEKKDFALFLAENVLSSTTKTYLLPQLKEMVETMFPQGGEKHE